MTSPLNAVRAEREKWMGWKNIAPMREALADLPEVKTHCEYGDTIRLTSDEKVDSAQIERVARMLMPWRKGPFELFGLFIDTEWQSFMKYNLLRPHFDLKDRRVADIGCNNGYYLFRMQEDAPAKLVGFDPSALYKTQFDFINHFAKTEIVYELLTIFCLGVLYHRSDPVAMLKQLHKGLDERGEVYLDTFMIDGDEEICLTPAGAYSKIPNIYFVPTVPALRNWCMRAGFTGFVVLETSVTTLEEQRRTDWIEGQSLEDFLDPEDPAKTVEGYPAPKRVYVRLTKEPKS
jgi:tRNA (mo5U34)-methyltransferase